MTKITYTIGAFRAAGLEAKWGKSAGRPYIFARRVGTTTFWLMSGRTFERAKEVGISEAFDEATALADIFSVRA